LEQIAASDAQNPNISTESEYTNAQQDLADGDIIHRTPRHGRLYG
jgi:hypothetical protein